MKTTKRTFGKLLALALVFLFALTAVVGVLAEPVDGQGSLKVTIRNNEGLPAMKQDQFSVYQIFKGKANWESEITSENSSAASEWDASQWNNWTLADITWGDSVKPEKLVTALKGLSAEDYPWAYEGENNVFKDVTETDPESLAKVLAAHPQNEFLQSFSAYLMDNKMTLELTEITLTSEEEGKTNPELVPGDTDSAADDSLVFTFKEAGYYLFAEKREEHIGDEHKDDAVAEYMLAVVGEQNILLKASVPKVDKEIVGGDNGKKGDAAGVGDYVQFKLTGTLPKNFGDFDTYEYIFHDTLSAGLTYVKDDISHPLTVRVYKDQAAANEDTSLTGGEEIPATYTADPAGVNYTVKETGTEETGPKCNLEVSFDDLKELKKNGDTDPETISVTAESVIVVTYWAKVNDNAVILDDGNPNTALLEYSNDPNNDGTGKTKEKTVYVYAFGLDLTKVGSDNTAEGLSDAGFVLKKGPGPDTKYAIFEDQWVLTSADGNSQSFYTSESAAKDANTAGTGKVSGPVKRLTGWTSESSDPTTTRVAELIAAYKAGTENAGLEKFLLISGDNGKIPDIYGLDEGSYALEEVIVPDGYNTPEEDFDISIDATINADTGKLEKVVYTHDEKTVTYKASYETNDPDYADSTDLVARFSSGLLKDTIVNQKAPFLPFTGGIGTTIFYVLGTLLIAGAITYLVIATKKRKSAE